MLRTSVPEAPVYKHRDARTGEHEVRPATVEQGPPKAKSETQCVHGAAQRHFGCGVSCTPSSQMRSLGCGHPGSRTFPRRRGAAAVGTRHHNRLLGISVEGHPAPQPALTLFASTHLGSTDVDGRLGCSSLRGHTWRSPCGQGPRLQGRRRCLGPGSPPIPTLSRAQVGGQVVLGAVARRSGSGPTLRRTTDRSGLGPADTA